MELPIFSFSDLLSMAVNAKTLLAGSTAVLGLSIGVKKVGLVRALTLGWRSAIKMTYPVSVRTAEIDALKESLQFLQPGQYVTVLGGKGNGKSRLIDTALNRTYGVIKTSVQSGENSNDIVNKTLTGITGIDITFVKMVRKARRVLFFYNLFFERPPIVVIRVQERQAGEKYADVTAAVRTLADDYELRVVVDGSPNALPQELLATYREKELTVEPMSREMIESIPEFQYLVERLRKFKLDNAVWQVFGGCPAMYMAVQSEIANCPDNAVVARVKRRLIAVLQKATAFVRTCSPNTETIVELFREKQILQISASELKKDLKKGRLIVDFPNKVFRQVSTGHIEPATCAVGLIIRENVDSPQDIANLVERL